MRNLKRVLLLASIFCICLQMFTYAVIGYPEWYYKKFGDYPDGTVFDWENDPVYHGYLAETGQSGGGGGSRRYDDDRYYPKPCDLEWKGKTAKWSVEGWASKYQVELYRDGTRVCSKTTTSRSFSFSSYMSRGDNDYFFKVRAYNSNSGFWSDWEQSDEKEIRSNDPDDQDNWTGPGVVPVIIPGGQPVVPSTAGRWMKANNRWRYVFANGAYATNTWLNLSNKWYFFDTSSYMVTGWLNDKGKTYFLGADGAMVTGAVIIDGINHFFDSTGAMVY